MNINYPLLQLDIYYIALFFADKIINYVVTIASIAVDMMILVHRNHRIYERSIIGKLIFCTITSIVTFNSSKKNHKIKT